MPLTKQIVQQILDNMHDRSSIEYTEEFQKRREESYKRWKEINRDVISDYRFNALRSMCTHRDHLTGLNMCMVDDDCKSCTCAVCGETIKLVDDEIDKIPFHYLTGRIRAKMVYAMVNFSHKPSNTNKTAIVAIPDSGDYDGYLSVYLTFAKENVCKKFDLNENEVIISDYSVLGKDVVFI